MNYVKKYFKNIFLFCFFLISLVFIFTVSRGDTFVNYGFSYAISKGEIPYKDFNMVISPLAPFLYSIGLLLNKNILIFYAEQAFLLTVFYNVVKKILKDKSILFLLFILLPFPIAMSSTIFPGYNFLLIFLFVCFLYYFEKNNNDYLLGILLGLIFCTKQTIGIVVFIPTFYYLFKDRKKFFKMLIGYFVPIILLFSYLLFTNSLRQFIDLCFLGLLDFGHSNQQIYIFYFILFVIGIMYLLYCIYKDKKEISLYYCLFFSSVVLPIIDYYHVSLFLIIIFIIFLKQIDINSYIKKISLLLIIVICTIWSFVSYNFFGSPVISNFNNFSLVINRGEYVSNTEMLLKYVNKLDKRVIYFMRGSENYYYKIINNQKLDYFDLPNYGNYGYNGINKMYKKIDKVHNTYFVLDRELVKNKDVNQQYIKELGLYVIKNSIKVESIGYYDIYYKE